MTTARARAVSVGFALGSILTAAVFASAANAACVGDGTANTCVLNLGNVATETGDGAGGTDTLEFTGGGFLSLNTNTIGSVASGPVRFVNYEEGLVTGGTALTLTGLTSDAILSSFNWTIAAGNSLFAQGGNAIGDASTVTVAGSFAIGGDGTTDETIGRLLGSGTVNLLNGRTLTISGNNDSSFTGGIVSTGKLTKAGAGKLTLSADNSYTGATTVNGGTLEIGHAGAIDDSSSVTIARAGTLTGTVAYNIGGAVTNDGVLAGNVTITDDVTNTFAMRPGQSAGTMTIIGNYTGSGPTAHFDMEVDLDAAIAAPVNGTTHDFVDIQGSASGKTFILLTPLNTPDAGLPTTGNGIQLIRVTGTTAADTFQQFNALNVGAYQYLLTYVPNYGGILGTDDGYFLQRAVRDELVAHPALLSAGQELIRSCHRDDQRIPDSPKGATYGRGWLGYHQGNTSFGTDTGIEMDLDYSCTTGGMDWRIGNGWVGGVIAGFGSATGDLVAPAGVGNLDGDSRVFEVYAAFTRSAFFLNLSAGYADMDWIYRGALTLGQASSSGLIAGAQAGTAVDLEFMAVKLIGALNYDDTNCGEACFGFAATEDTGLLEAKGTVRIDGNTSGGSIKPWASVSYSDVISDGINTVSLGAVSVSSDTNGERLSIDAGLQAYLDENFALYADGGYHESLGKDISGYKGGVGVKLYW
jgi:autotransporter-associated beta strand protein